MHLLISAISDEVIINCIGDLLTLFSLLRYKLNFLNLNVFFAVVTAMVHIPSFSCNIFIFYFIQFINQQ